MFKVLVKNWGLPTIRAVFFGGVSITRAIIY